MDATKLDRVSPAATSAKAKTPPAEERPARAAAAPARLDFAALMRRVEAEVYDAP